MDHYAPKSGVARTILQHGREADRLGNVEDRVVDRAPSGSPAWRGYAWRAYDWDNYVLCCNRCNTGWKRTLFPAVSSGVIVHGEAVQGRDERPLLLNPYDHHPAAHLDFRPDGFVYPKTDEGRATVDVLGLNGRETLVRRRMAKAREARSLLRDQAVDLVRLVEIGADDQPHAAVVRCVAEEMTGCSWDEIVRAAAAPTP